MADDGNRPSDVLRRQLPELRKRLGDLSAQGLADRITAAGGDMHRAVLSKIETGNRTVTLDDVVLLAAVLDVSPLHLFVPLDDDAEVEVTPTLTVSADQARRWIRGQEPLPGMDERTFRTEVPLGEWEEAQKPSADEQRAMNTLDNARHRLRVAERKLALVADSPATLSMSSTVAALAMQQSPEDVLERRMERAWTDVAEAEVYLEDAVRDLDAIRRARSGGQG